MACIYRVQCGILTYACMINERMYMPVTLATYHSSVVKTFEISSFTTLKCKHCNSVAAMLL